MLAICEYLGACQWKDRNICKVLWHVDRDYESVFLVVGFLDSAFNVFDKHPCIWEESLLHLWTIGSTDAIDWLIMSQDLDYTAQSICPVLLTIVGK